MAGIPAYIVWYKLIGEMMMFIHVKKIAPDYKDGYSSEPIKLDPEQWLEFLEYQQVKHYPHCTKKELFDKKLREDMRANRRKAFAPILHK
jgi:hypothetical protein